VGEKYLIFSPLNQVTSLVNAKALEILKAGLLAGRQTKKIPASLTELIKSLSSPTTPPRVSDRQLDPAFLGFIPTRACNMVCRYCDFGALDASHEYLGSEMVKSAIDWSVEHLCRGHKKILEVHFFGGEPFVAPEIVDFAVHYARMLSGRYNFEVKFVVSTNGFFSEKRAGFVGDYFDSVTLSLDGFKEFHDLHRPAGLGQGSFDRVCHSAKRLSEAPARLCIRCCISQQSTACMEDFARWFCQEFQPAAINFEPLTANPVSLSNGLEVPDPYVFARNHFRATQVAEEYGVKCVNASTILDEPRTTFCPVGKDALIVSPDGSVSSCYLPERTWQEKELDLRVGEITTTGKVEIDFTAITRLRALGLNKPRCDKCFCRWTCAGGCHVNNTYPGCSENYTDFCIYTRILSACKLLSRMGLEREAEFLMASPIMMEKLAENVDDNLC